MTNLPAVRWLRVLGLLVLVVCLRPDTFAQSLPFAPISPTSPEECQSFGAAVEAYAADYSAQHEKCLADNKPDRPDETKDSLVCSRSRCQYLHDMLYGDSVLSVKSKQKEVSACYERVKEYQADKLRKEKEEAEEEAQEKQDEADRATRRQKDKDAQETRDKQKAADQAARELADKNALDAARKAASDRLAAQQSQANALQLASSGQQTPRTTGLQDSNPPSALVDPFPDSGPSNLQRQEIAANESMVDPFAPEDSLADPFPNSEWSRSEATGKQEEAWDGAKGIFQGFVDKAPRNLGDELKAAEKEMSPSDFRKFEQTTEDAHAFLGGLSKVITAVTFQKDIEKIANDPRNLESYHDFISDGASYGTSYVLERLSPDFLSKIYEGPLGWMASITFDSSSTQTSKQDFDPMTALNNPGQYSFKQREAALQSLYESAQRHPEIWTPARYQWLYGVSDSLYNSPDNPNIHLTPPSSPSSPNINLTPH